MGTGSSDDYYGQTVVRVTRQYDAQLKPLGDLALAELVAKKGEHIIDMGCGAAQTCLQLAKAVGPNGLVLGIDRSPVLSRFAVERTQTVSQIKIVNADIIEHSLERRSYDALYSRFGVMAFEDPVPTFSNLRGALKHNGRLAFVCWRRLKENELDYLPFNAARNYLPYDAREAAETAYPFSFAAAETITDVLSKAGFKDIRCTPHDIDVCAGDIEETLALCLSAGSLGAIMRRMPSLVKKVTDPVREALLARQSEQGVFMGAAVWVVSANI